MCLGTAKLRLRLRLHLGIPSTTTTRLGDPVDANFRQAKGPNSKSDYPGRLVQTKTAGVAIPTRTINLGNVQLVKSVGGKDLIRWW